MTYAERNFMGSNSHRPEGRPRERLADFLDRRYRGRGRIKELAADMGATPKAAENVLAGHWPNDLHLKAIIQRFGADVWDAVFAPDIDAHAARLAQEENELEEALELVRQRQRQATGRRKGRPHRLAAVEARPVSPDG